MARLHRVSAPGAAPFLIAVLALAPAACGGGDADAAEEASEVDRQLDLALMRDSVEAELKDQADAREEELKRREEAIEREREMLRREEELRRRERELAERTRRAEAAAPPAAPAPAPAAEPTPPPPPPEPETVVLAVPAGTTYRARLVDELSTATNRAGDTFTIRLSEPIVAGRDVLAPTGATVVGTVTGIRQGEDGTIIELDFTDVLIDGAYYPIRASLVSADVESRSTQSGGDRAAKVGGGAAVGALLGGLLGGGKKGALIGAVVGAGAGTGVMLATDGRNAVLPADSELTIQLDTALEVEVPR